MAHDTEAERLAAYLRMLKDRTGRSFDALGRRAGVSSSSLHRYCAGSTVPSEFASLHAFGRACGGTRDELRELQRLWVLADASRDRNRTTADEPTAADTPTTSEPSTDKVVEPADPVADSGVSEASPAGPGLSPLQKLRSRFPRILPLAVGVLVALLGVTAGGIIFTTRTPGHPASAPSARDDQLLFSPACREAVGQGRQDECVREVQRLLEKAGARLAVDGSYGPETLRRVTAFQVLAGLPVRGIVDDATKHALYKRKVSLHTWSTADVERRIREVFVEEPDRAVAIADCQSYLDPLWVQPNTNGTRNWGVFQISEYRLRLFRGSPRQALDPEWNIQTAYQLWKAQPDFGDWPSCARAAGIPRSPAAAPVDNP